MAFSKYVHFMTLLSVQNVLTSHWNMGNIMVYKLTHRHKQGCIHSGWVFGIYGKHSGRDKSRGVTIFKNLMQLSFDSFISIHLK